MISSYFKNEVLAIRDEFFTLGHKGLSTHPPIDCLVIQIFALIMQPRPPGRHIGINS